MSDYIINTINERANDMLKDEHVRLVYNSFQDINKAQEWIIYTALYTLTVPLNERINPLQL